MAIESKLPKFAASHAKPGFRKGDTLHGVIL